MRHASQFTCATRDDASAIHDIYAPIVRDSAISFEMEPPSVDEIAQRIETITADYPWLVSVVDGALAGYAYANAFRARPAYRATAEVSIAVATSHRRRGLALPLYAGLLEELARRDFHSAVAVIARPNEASVALHVRAGFTRVGVLREAGYKFDAWHDVELWQRML